MSMSCSERFDSALLRLTLRIQVARHIAGDFYGIVMFPCVICLKGAVVRVW